jgi:glycogen(starch) synthase
MTPDWCGDGALYARRRDGGPLVTQLQSSLAQIRSFTPDRRRLGDLRLHRVVQTRLERVQAEASAAISACSTAVLERARAIWDIAALPTSVLPNPIDVERVRRIARDGKPPDGFPEGSHVVVYAGRLEGLKGVHILAESMNRVWASGQEVDLVLIGRDGLWEGQPMSSHCRQVAGRYATRVHILGEQPPERLYPALAAADVIALPSLWETFSLVALEAIAVGAPLVATRDNGFDDLVTVDQDGMLVSPGDSGELAVALLRLLEDASLRQRLGAAASQTANLYDIEPVARRYADFFEAVASSTHARAA